MTQTGGDTLDKGDPAAVPNLSTPVEVAEREAFCQSFLSDEFAVRAALLAMEEQMKARDLPAEAIGDLAVVLAEALNNVVEHAHADRCDGRIELAVYLRSCCIRCRIFDNGLPMPGLELPAGLLPNSDTDLDDLPEGGFGWFLIRNMTADLAYERLADGNQLQFHIPLAGYAEAGS